MSCRFNRRSLYATSAMGIVLALLLAGTGVATAQADLTSEPVNILLLGSDARPGEAIDGVRSDIMVVLHLDPAAGACRMLSIPRDTRVEIPGIGYTKINHALMEGGVPLTTETVERFLGIDIDHYGLIDFVAAAQIIDALGGVTVTNEYAFDIGGNHYPAGEQRLDGARAVLYARYRYGPDGDFGRIHRQQQVFAGLIRELQGASVTQLTQAAWGSLGPHIMSDLTPAMLLELASTYGGSCNGEALVIDTIPDTAQGYYWDDLFQQELWFVVVDPAVVQQKVDALIHGE